MDLAALALAFSLLIPYAKARAAMETAVDNFGWPDLFERGERMLYLGVVVPAAYYFHLLPAALLIFIILCLLTFLQRVRRALGVIE